MAIKAQENSAALKSRLEKPPESMRAVEITTPGGPEVLQVRSIPTPAPGPGEILVRVAAAGVNRPDAIQRQGHYPPPPGAPMGLPPRVRLRAISAWKIMATSHSPAMRAAMACSTWMI